MTAEKDLIARVEELETKLMFQEDVVEQLNNSIIAQQKDIKRLTHIIEQLTTQVEDMKQPNVIDANLETPPPHY
ncbi:MAG: SlyX family protein [Kangiellaceae bacterium]|nr:SlyX family protein [Kangiellaceae bacterium]MCW8998522.1 SlyX family protein [Kangiellaceae bacterium]MCW9015782.1 SlyX family protein [Kangiellaceae bacterium]